MILIFLALLSINLCSPCNWVYQLINSILKATTYSVRSEWKENPSSLLLDIIEVIIIDSTFHFYLFVYKADKTNISFDVNLLVRKQRQNLFILCVFVTVFKVSWHTATWIFAFLLLYSEAIASSIGRGYGMNYICNFLSFPSLIMKTFIRHL